MITNNGSAPAYLRVAVDIYWQDQNGARLWDEPVAGTDYVIAWGSVSKASASNTASSWVVASDGYYYWTSPVAPMGKTDVLIKSVTEQKADGRTWSLTFRPRQFNPRPAMQLQRHGAVQSRMACWCRRMEVRKYGVPDS